MKSVLINSKKIAATVFNRAAALELTEVENIAEELNIYGNVIAYKVIKKGGNKTIIFDLDKPFSEFIKSAEVAKVPIQQTLNNPDIAGFEDEEGKSYTFSDEDGSTNELDPSGNSVITVTDNITGGDVKKQVNQNKQVTPIVK